MPVWIKEKVDIKGNETVISFIESFFALSVVISKADAFHEQIEV